MTGKELITAQVLAQDLNLSVETIWRYTRERRIPYIELGSKQYRYNLEEVLQALSSATDHGKKNNGNSSAENNIVWDQPTGYKTGDKNNFTYQDYLLLPEDTSYHYEVLEGMLVKEPSPNVNHQRVSRRLQRILEDYFWKCDLEGEIFNAPLDVTFSDITVVQPDIFYVSGEQKQILKETRVDGPPTLVVEILSPSNSRKDRLQKLQIYQKYKVPHYWLVDPKEKTLECFSLTDGTYALIATGMEKDVVEHPDFKGLEIPLANLWYGNSAT